MKKSGQNTIVQGMWKGRSRLVEKAGRSGLEI